jgi:cytochrome c peroxidase
MMRPMLRASILLLPLLLVESCKYQCGDAECLFSNEEWDIVETMSPLPPLEPDPTNKYVNDEAAARFGQIMFYESRYSGALKIGDDGTNGALGPVGVEGLMGCYACHIPETYFMDTRSKPGNVSLGVTYTERNAPTLVNAAYYRYQGFAGKQDSLWNQAALSFESSTNSAGNRCGLAHLIFDNYREIYDSVFETPMPTSLSTTAPDASRFPAKCKPKKADDPDGAWELMAEEDRQAILDVLANQGKAIAAYEAKLVSGNAPFDQYAAGDTSAISDSAKRGLKLFIGKAACVDCHRGAIFSDNGFHNLGVPQEGPNLLEEDDGHYTDVKKLLSNEFNSLTRFNDGPDPGDIPADLEPRETDKGKFRTSILRGVALTAPYMHSGGYATLREVVEFYNRGGDTNDYPANKSPTIVQLGLTNLEMEDLVAFLESLTGEPIPAELMLNPLE